MSGLAGSTHEQNISNIAVHDLLYLFLKTFFWLFSKPLHWTIKRCRKHKGKLEQGNIGLYLQTCGVLLGLLLPMFFIRNAPESLAAKAHHPHNIGHFNRKNTTEFVRIWLCHSFHTDSQGRPGAGLNAGTQNHHQAKGQPVISQNATTAITAIRKCPSKSWTSLPLRG